MTHSVGVIYAASNVVDGRVYNYIGKTKQDFGRRWDQHCQAALKRPWTKIRLQQAIRKHGAESFMIELVAVATDESTLNDFERMYIEEYKANDPDFGYNMTTGGEGFGWGNQINTGRKLAPEHKAAIGLANRKPKSLEGRENMRRAQKRRVGISWGHHTEETKKRLSLTHKGRHHGKLISPRIKIRLSPEEIFAKKVLRYKRAAEANRGKKRSPEFCQGLRERTITDKQRQNCRIIGLSNLGRVLSEEEKEVKRMSAIKAQQKKTPEQRSDASRKAWIVRRAKYGPTGEKPK